MKALFVVLSGLLFSLLTLSSQDHHGAKIEFDREVHSFGEITTDNVPEGKISFKIYNNGNQPLLLQNVRACCGTRVSDYTRQPIAPADSGFVQVEFRIGPTPHTIRRTVTIQSNDPKRQTAILRIQGDVVEPKAEFRL